MDSYVSRQVTTLCRRHRVRRKILLVPSRQAGYNLTNWVAREGKGWVNLVVETPQSLAERLARPLLEARGLERVSPDVSLFLVHDAIAAILTEFPEEEVTAFRPGSGLTRSVASTVGALTLANVGPSELAAGARASVRHRFLAAVYREFLKRMEARNGYGQAQVYRTAADVAQTSSYVRQAVVAVADEVRLPALAYEFLEVCRQTSLEFWRVGRSDFGVDPPAEVAGRRFAQCPFVSPSDGAVHPAGQVRAKRLQPEDGYDVQIRDAVGVDAEVRGVFREILALGHPLDEVELVYTDPTNYAPRIATVAEQLSVPVEFGEGLPAYLTRPGRAILGFYRWLAEGLDARVLVHLLRSGLISFGARKVGALALAEVLQSGRARQGRDDHLAALDRDRRGQRQSSDPEKEARRLASVEARQSALTELLDLADEGTTTVRRLAQAGRTFLTEFFRPGSDTDSRSLESIIDRLEGLCAIDATGECVDMAEMLVELMRGHRVGISVAREGSLYAVPVSKAGYAGRSRTFVIGLDESSFPGGAVEDPLLPDHERRRLSAELDERLARPGESVWELLRYLGTACGGVTLVANRFDLIDGRERYASSVFAQCREDLAAEDSPRYSPSFTASQAMTASDVWITERETEGYDQAVAASFPWLKAGEEAEHHRSTDLLSRYDGYLGRGTPELSLVGVQVLSASRLERLASCPYRYFLQDVLRVRPLDDTDDDDHHWLNPRHFGSVVHDVLCRFMRTVAERDERPEPDRHRSELHELVESTASEARLKIPPETELAFKADVQRLKRTMDVFLAADAAADYVKPVEFEMRFGWDTESPRFPSPISVDLGEGVTLALRGSIDRVDETQHGFVIWDYKTGSSVSFDRSDLFLGQKLQWALYALAYRRMIDGLPTALGVTQSGYFFVGERESGRRIVGPVPEPSEVRHRIRPLIDMVENGAFFHFQRSDRNSSPCRFCDFKRLCEKERRGKENLDGAMQSSVPKIVLDSLNEWITR